MQYRPVVMGPRTRVGVYNALIAGGLMLGTAFPPSPLWPLGLVAFLPLFWAMSGAQTFGQVVRWSYLAFFFYHGVANWWVGSWQPEADPFLLLSGVAVWIVHPIFFTLPWIGWWWLYRHGGMELAIGSFPFLWTAFEWLHGLGELGYPWLSVGYILVPVDTLIQIADLGGVWLLSWWVVGMNVLFWFLIQAMRRSRYPMVIGFGGIILLWWLLPLGYGEYRLRQLAAVPIAQSLSTIIVQPNTNPWQKWEKLQPAQHLQQHIVLVDSVRITLTRPVDLVVWSETAIPFWITWYPYRQELQRLRRWIDSTDIALLTGFPDLIFYSSPPNALAKRWRNDSLWYETFNSLLLIQPEDTTYQVYHKIRLTPFAERAPYVDMIPILADWIRWGVGISAWAKGQKQRLLSIRVGTGDTVRLGPVICIESIFPDFVANLVRMGADGIVIVTNDGWFKRTPGPEQHFQIARMRAVETRRTIVRCANTGISGIILPTGAVLQRIEEGIRQALWVNVPLFHYPSPYVQLGDWLPLLSMGLVVILLGWMVGRRRYRRELQR